MSPNTPLLPGTLELVVLQLLQAEPTNGYDLALRIQAITKGVLNVNAGSLYPALYRLEKRGLIKGRWQETESGRRAKTYSVTNAPFVSAIERLDQCRDPERFKSWLMVIVRRKALNLVDHRVDASAPWGGEVRDGRADSMERTAVDELRSNIEQVLSRLSPLQGRVFRLHDLDGWTHAEIATELGISTGSSRVHLHKARYSLRARLSPIYRSEVHDY